MIGIGTHIWSSVLGGSGIAVPEAGTWDGGFWDTRDLTLAEGERALNWPAREGSIPWTAVDDATAPTWDADGLVSRGALRFTAANSQRMRADGLASLVAGDDVPFTVTVAIRSLWTSGTVGLIGFGQGSNLHHHDVELDTNQAFIRTNRASGGAPPLVNSSVRGKNGQRLLITVEFTGTQARLWCEKNVTTLLACDVAALGGLNVAVLGARAIASITAFFNGYVVGVGLTSQSWSAAKQEAVYNHFWGVPKTIWFLGDSITVGNDFGMRSRLWFLIGANNYRADYVGTQELATGSTFGHDKHDGVNGHTIAAISSKVTAQVGGATIGSPDMVMLMIGTNNTGSGTYDGTDTPNEYADLLDQIATALPNTKLVVTTIPPYDAATDATRSANTDDYNSKLPAKWDAFDTAHPSNTLIRWDANACLGGVWSSANFADAAHPNATGHDLMADDATNGFKQAVEPTLQTF